MTRREFTLSVLGGSAMLAVPTALSHAAAQMAPPVAPPRPRLPASTQQLLDRAKAALDAHHDAFQLRDRVALADFSVASREMRFHIVDLISGQTNSYLVAHGRGSDPEHSGWLQRFSNDPGSLATSEGAYRTENFYFGVHGQAMRLTGLDPVNNNAMDRAIVLHSADYVSENHIATWGKLGRSEGCFVVARHMLPQVLGMLGSGRLLYAGRVT